VTRRQYDTIVVGLGAMGSATAYHLAKRGQRVLALEQFSPGHTRGSSHGDSRIIREQYFEHPLYVPLVQRAYTLWRELEQETQGHLMSLHGGLMMGRPDSDVVTGTIRSARAHGLPHDVLSAREIHHRFPAFAPADDIVAVFDPHAGILDPDACNRAHITQAQALGAEMNFGEAATSWSATDGGVEVRTGFSQYSAAQLVLTAGSWTRQLLGDVPVPLSVERQVLFWFDVPREREAFARDRFPIYAFQHSAETFCYGFPRMLRGAKAAIMHQGESYATPEQVRRDVDPGEVEPLRAALRPILPGLADAPVREAMVCLFTNTPDKDFVIDRHPEHENVLISSPCSGHGFKFASAIGEVHADLITARSSRFDLAPFALSRFRGPS
jgi:sarcosine oxidase